MAIYLVETVEVIKRQYFVEASSDIEANNIHNLEKCFNSTVISNSIFSSWEMSEEEKQAVLGNCNDDIK